MLRASTKQSVFNALDESYFGSSNFEITYGNGDPLWVLIVFIPNINFRYEIARVNLGVAVYQTREAPGLKFLKAEVYMAKSFEECVSRISAWVDRVKEEVIDANPIARELQSVRAELEQRVASLAERQEEFFTHIEAAELKARIDAFTQQLKKLAEENEGLKEAVHGLQGRLDDLGNATQSVNKGTWLRMASSRLLNATKAVLGSKEARELALEAAKKVLLEGPK